MKRILFFLIFFSIFKTEAQHFYYGYPADYNTIGCGDELVVNIPIHREGRFLPNQGIERLIELLNISEDFIFIIEIYDFQASSNLVYAYTDFLCDNLINYLDSKCTYNNYYIYSCGNSKNLFCTSDLKIFNLMNTRLEIKIKCQE